MGSSGGGSFAAPRIPAPTGAPINGPGGSPASPQYTSFLTPNQVTSSISPQAIAQMQAQQDAAIQAREQQAAAARAQLASMMAPQGMRNQFNQLSGQELLGMKLGMKPQNFNAQQARNDQLMRIFAGGMGPRAAGAGGGAGRSGGHSQ
jgi:hypothetical protein